MNLKNWLLGAAAAVAFSAVGTTAQSAPLGNLQADRASEQNTAVQNVAWVRRCYSHRGHRHCRRVWRDYGYYDPEPNYYGGPYAYGPSIGFFFGGGRHGHHGGHHHHGGHGGHGRR
jgi:hypothetical protein